MKHFQSIATLFLTTLTLCACQGPREPYTPFPLSSAPSMLSPRAPRSFTDLAPVVVNTPKAASLPNQASTADRNAVAFPPPPTEASGEMTVKRVAGVWNATILGTTCKLATPQTKFGEGFRAGPLHCPTPLDSVKSWNLAEKELVLYGATGTVLARLHFAGGRFDGQFGSGEPITLSR